MGFQRPTTTPTPDEIFDVWLSELTGSELKVLLYIVRRTFGFRKDSDAISLSQITQGIRKKNGEILDRGTGISRKSAYKAVQALEERGLIKVDRTVAEDGINEINIYSLVFEGRVGEKFPYGREKSSQGVGEKLPYGRGKTPLGVGEKFPPQQTVLQETVLQETDLSKFERSPPAEKSSHPPPNNPLSENISRLMTDFSKQVFHDSEHIRSNITQAHNIWYQSELSEEEFLEALHTVKRIVLKWSGNIRKLANGEAGLKNRAPYFFQALRNLALPESSQRCGFLAETRECGPTGGWPSSEIRGEPGDPNSRSSPAFSP